MTFFCRKIKQIMRIILFPIWTVDEYKGWSSLYHTYYYIIYIYLFVCMWFTHIAFIRFSGLKQHPFNLFFLISVRCTCFLAGRKN